MYKLTIETNSLDELYNTISNLRGNAQVTLGEVTDEGQPVKKMRKPKAVESVVTSDAETVQIEKDAVDYATVSKITLELVKSKGKPNALAILETYGAKNAQQLKPEDWAAYVTKATEELAKPVNRL